MKNFENKTFTLGEKLTDEQLAYFEKYGVIQFKNFINKDTIQLFINEAQKVLYSKFFMVLNCTNLSF